MATSKMGRKAKMISLVLKVDRYPILLLVDIC